MKSRTIVIGDIHGCSTELQLLLDELRVGADDRLICVGDLICKGPASVSVLEWAMRSPNVTCVRGNHEQRFLDYWRTGDPDLQKPYDPAVVQQMGRRFEEFMRFLESWPLYVDLEDALVVHAGLDPRIADLRLQDRRNLTHLRHLPECGTPWFEKYRSKKLIVFGHWARRQLIVRDNAIGLDTGCVYGGALSAVVLPERRIVSVRARDEYYKKSEWREA